MRSDGVAACIGIQHDSLQPVLVSVMGDSARVCAAGQDHLIAITITISLQAVHHLFDRLWVWM